MWMTRNLCVTNAFRRRASTAGMQHVLETRHASSPAQHMVPLGVYRREIEASRVRRAYRGQTRKRTVVCRASHGRERHLTFDDSHWEILSKRERERERERENVARVSSRTRLIVVVSLDFYTCDIPSLINIYLSNSRIIRTPSGPIIVVISPMLAPRPRPLVLAARFSRTAATNVRSTHRRNTSFTRLYSFSVNWPTAVVSRRVTKRARCVVFLNSPNNRSECSPQCSACVRVCVCVNARCLYTHTQPVRRAPVARKQTAKLNESHYRCA